MYNSKTIVILLNDHYTYFMIGRIINAHMINILNDNI